MLCKITFYVTQLFSLTVSIKLKLVNASCISNYATTLQISCSAQVLFKKSFIMSLRNSSKNKCYWKKFYIILNSSLNILSCFSNYWTFIFLWILGHQFVVCKEIVFINEQKFSYTGCPMSTVQTLQNQIPRSEYTKNSPKTMPLCRIVFENLRSKSMTSYPAPEEKTLMENQHRHLHMLADEVVQIIHTVYPGRHARVVEWRQNVARKVLKYVAATCDISSFMTHHAFFDMCGRHFE